MTIFARAIPNHAAGGTTTHGKPSDKVRLSMPPRKTLIPIIIPIIRRRIKVDARKLLTIRDVVSINGHPRKTTVFNFFGRSTLEH